MTVDTWVSLAVLIAGLAGLYAALRRETKSEIGDLRSELKSEIGELRSELKTDIADLRSELKTDIADLRADLKADIRRLDGRVEKLDERVYDLAVGMRPLLSGAQRSAP